MLVKDKYKCENCGGNELACIVKVLVDLSDFPIDDVQIKDDVKDTISEVDVHDDCMEFLCLNCGHPYMEGEISDLMEALNCEE